MRRNTMSSHALSVTVALSVILIALLVGSFVGPDSWRVVWAKPPQFDTPHWAQLDTAAWANKRTIPNMHMTGADLLKARAQAAKLPQTSQLPPSNRRQAVHATPQPPSGAWQPIGPTAVNYFGLSTVAGQVNALAVDPATSGAHTVVYAGADGGGVWKSTNAGASWTPLTDQQSDLAISSLAIDPANHNILYAGTGSVDTSTAGVGILKSTNGGASWTLLGNSTFAAIFGSVNKIVVNPLNDQQLFVLSSVEGFPYLYVSNDGGVTYAQVAGLPSPAEVTDLALNAQTNPVTLYAAMAYNNSSGGGMYRSTDGASTWTQLTNGLPASANWRCEPRVAVAPSNPSVVYTTVPDANCHTYNPSIPYEGGYYTTNGGSSWQPMASLNRDISGYLTVDPNSDQLVYGAGNVDVFLTTNARGAGGNWRNITSAFGFDNSYIHPYPSAMAFAPQCAASPCAAYFANSGGVYYSNNTTALPVTHVTYADDNTNLSIDEFSGGALGPSYVDGHSALGSDSFGNVLYSGDSTWPLTNQSGSFGNTVIDQSNPQVMYATGSGNALLKSTDGGFDWTNTNAGGQIGCCAYQQNLMPFALDPINEQHLVAATNAVYETINGTTTWYQDSQALSSQYYSTSAVAIAPTHSNIVYVGLQSGAFYSTTSAGTGSQVTYTQGASLPNKISSISVDPTDPTGMTIYATVSIYMIGNPFGVFKSTNGGASWTNISGSLPGTAVYTSVVYPSGANRVVVVGSDVGVFFTTNDGATWTQLSGNLPNAPIAQLALDAQLTTLAAFTSGRGAWTIDIPESTGGTGDTPGVFRPSSSTFYLRNSLTTGPADEVIAFGNSTSLPVAGDWNGDGIDSIGTFNPANAQWQLQDVDANGNPTVDTFTFGAAGDLPVVGDWTGSGHDSIGIFRPSTGTFYLRNNLTSGVPDYTITFGASGDLPVAGDWSGQGYDTVGLYRPSTAMFYLTNTRCSCAPPVNYAIAFGIAGDVPFIGDWTHAGHTGLGVFRPTNGLIYMRNDATTSGFANFNIVYGVANDRPVAGHWV